MTDITFPRQPDGLGHAWGLISDTPTEISERLSPAYENRLARLVTALQRHGLKPRIGGAGGQDGEYIVAQREDGRQIFHHLEDPHETAAIAALIVELEAELGL